MDFRPFLLVGFAFTAGAAPAQAPSPGGYLSPDRAPDTARILQAAPAPNSARAAADRAIFRATRALKDTPRWKLAQNDVSETILSTLADFSCATRARLSEASAPKLASLLHRLRFDVIAAVNGPKNLYRRQRPYLIDKGDICVDKTLSLAASPDYPSGHTTWSWAVGLVLAEVDPDRAAEVLSRARAYGESRVVCGVHNASAIEAGRTDASALVAALHGDAAFRADLDGARAEMAALRASGPPDAGACSAEAALTANSPW